MLCLSQKNVCATLSMRSAIFRGGNAFMSFPEERVLDSLQNAGHRFAAFKNTPTHELPDYILEDPEVLLIEEELR